MSRNTLPRTVGLGLLVVTLIVMRGIGRLPVPSPRRLPVETLAQSLGDWKMVSQSKEDGALKKQLPTATVLERLYRDSHGRLVQVVLVTAESRDDLHNPEICLPSQGWSLVSSSARNVEGDVQRYISAAQGDSHADVLYWMTGYYSPPLPSNPILGGIRRVRDRLVGRQEGMSLFVRLLAERSDVSAAALDSMANALKPELARIKAFDRTQ